MAEFKFIGDPRANGHGPATFQVPGYVFGRDEWTLVDDAEAAERFRRHSHLTERQSPADEIDKRLSKSLHLLSTANDDAPAPPPKRRGRPRKV